MMQASCSKKMLTIRGHGKRRNPCLSPVPRRVTPVVGMHRRVRLARIFSVATMAEILIHERVLGEPYPIPLTGGRWLSVEGFVQMTE